MASDCCAYWCLYRVLFCLFVLFLRSVSKSDLVARLNAGLTGQNVGQPDLQIFTTKSNLTASVNFVTIQTGFSSTAKNNLSASP